MRGRTKIWTTTKIRRRTKWKNNSRIRIIKREKRRQKVEVKKWTKEYIEGKKQDE